MTPSQISVTLTGRTSTGQLSSLSLPAFPNGRIARTIGLGGDTAQLRVQAADLPSDWDLSKSVRLTLTAGSTVILDGYRIRRVDVAEYGQDALVGGTVSPRILMLGLETEVAAIRDGRGGSITAGTLNPVRYDGLVDTNDSNYRTVQQLATTAMAAMGVPYAAVPSSINTAIDGSTIVAPGPLDWGNANAAEELDSLLSQFGYACTFRNDGSGVFVHRLLRSGETFTPTQTVIDNAEPYQFAASSALRASRILVTSGRTRSTIITERQLAGAEGNPHARPPLEWVAHDTRRGEWLNNQGWSSRYASEIAPGDLEEFQDGPIDPDGDPERTREFGRIFSAVRVTGSDLDEASRFVSLPLTDGYASVLDLGGQSAIALVQGAVMMAPNQFRNNPAGTPSSGVRVGGLSTVSDRGVFRLPADMIYARVDGGDEGGYADMRALTGDELTIVFAHEARTGNVLTDYFIAGFEVSASSGALSVSQVSQATAQTWLSDTDVVKIEQPYLRRVLSLPLLDASPTPLNDNELNAIAIQIAKQRVADEGAAGAVIELRGLHDIEPGDMNGAVTSVTWDVGRAVTALTIRMHEVPRGDYDFRERAAQRSVTAGVRRYAMPGSSAASVDVTDGSSPVDRGTGDTQEASAATRGREASNAPAPREPQSREEERIKATEAGKMLAQITGSSSIGTGRWTYQWKEVRIDGTQVSDVGSRTHATHGDAVNLAEFSGESTQAVATGSVVALELASASGPSPTWTFHSAVAAEDGSGSASAEFVEGEIAAVSDSTPPINEDPLAQYVTYDVEYELPSDPGTTLTLEDQVPLHRYAQGSMAIVPAEVGTKCFVWHAAPTRKLLICEETLLGDPCPT